MEYVPEKAATLTLVRFNQADFGVAAKSRIDEGSIRASPSVP